METEEIEKEIELFNINGDERRKLLKDFKNLMREVKEINENLNKLIQK